MKRQGGFIDGLMLHIAAKGSWRIRYPVAVCALGASWWLFEHHTVFIPIIFLVCAAALAKEVSPSLLLLAAAIWVWPSGFFSIPFAQMTFSTLGEFLLSCLLFVSSIAAGLLIYAALQRAPADGPEKRGPAAEL
jgi:hypothetical protein